MKLVYVITCRLIYVSLIFSTPCFSADFNLAIPIVLKHEGKLVNNIHDKGGITNYGISLRFLKSLVRARPDLLAKVDVNHDKIINEHDVIHMPLKEAIDLYQQQFWDKQKLGNIVYQPLATKVFDMSVNMGNQEAVELLQEACNKLYNTHHLGIDGKLGNQTLNTINSLNPKQHQSLLKLLKKVSRDYYQHIAKKHPAYKQFLKGWLKRAEE